MICFDEMGSDFSAMPCGHVFHFNCIRDMHTACTNEPTDQERIRGVTKLKFQCPLRCSSGKAISLRDVLRLHLQFATTSADGSGSAKGKTGKEEKAVVITALEDTSMLKEDGLRALISSLHSKLEISTSNAEQRIGKLEADLSEGKKALAVLIGEVKEKDDQLRDYEGQISEYEGKLDIKSIELHNSKNTVQDLKSRLESAVLSHKRQLTALNNELTRIREDNKNLHNRMSAVDFKTTGQLDTLESERKMNTSRRLTEGTNEFKGYEYNIWKKGFQAFEEEEKAYFLGIRTRLERVEEERDQAVKAKQAAENLLKSAMTENRQVTEELNKKRVSLNDIIAKKRTSDASFLQLQERYDELKRKLSVNGVGGTSMGQTSMGQTSMGQTSMGQTSMGQTSSPISQGIVRSSSITGTSISSIAGMINQEKMGSIFSKPFAASTALPSWPLQQENPVQRVSSKGGTMSSASIPVGFKPSAPSAPKVAEQSTISWAAAPVPKAAISVPKPPPLLQASKSISTAPKPFFQTTLSQVVVDLADDDDDEFEIEISAPNIGGSESSQISKKRSFPGSERDVNAMDGGGGGGGGGGGIKKKPVQMSLRTSWALTKGDSLRTNSE